MENIRGEIHYRDGAKQINNFNGLIYGKITPTDIDGSLDFHGKCFVFFELKYKDTPLPDGQRWNLERIVKELGKPSICIVATHETPVHLDVDAANCIVREYFLNGKWHASKKPITLRYAIDWFVGKHAPECLFLRD